MSDFNVLGFLNKYMLADGYIIRPHVTCKDGAVFSIQASRMHYCTPKNCTGPWTGVEVAAISGHQGFGECHEVSIQEIENILDGHGGVVSIADPVVYSKEMATIFM